MKKDESQLTQEQEMKGEQRTGVWIMGRSNKAWKYIPEYLYVP